MAGRMAICRTADQPLFVRVSIAWRMRAEQMSILVCHPNELDEPGDLEENNNYTRQLATRSSDARMEVSFGDVNSDSDGSARARSAAKSGRLRSRKRRSSRWARNNDSRKRTKLTRP